MIPIASTCLLAVPAGLDPWAFVWAGLMLVVVFLGLLLIALVNRWRKKPESASLSTSDQLTQYRMMFEAGTLTKEEYEQLRTLLSSRLRSDFDVPPPVPPAPESPKPPFSGGSPPGREEPPAASEGIRPA